jgi:hypothetical protein
VILNRARLAFFAMRPVSPRQAGFRGSSTSRPASVITRDTRSVVGAGLVAACGGAPWLETRDAVNALLKEGARTPHHHPARQPRHRCASAR